ncbi:MAG: hypothetical protein KatS3mg120_0137 [Erythrobacter sp.]|nr:MAG: hypothetical protein KatS3mg120_0137 [Erythrobacter sp.]
MPLEGAFPLRRGQGAFRRGWLTDTQYFFASHVLAQVMSVAVLAPAVALGAVLALPQAHAAVEGLPWLVQWAMCVLVADLAQYGVHRAFHAVPLLWRFHKVHHSVEAMDWLAGSRLHLVDVIVTRGLVLLALLVAGFAESVVYAYLALVSFHAVFIHANFRAEMGVARTLGGHAALPPLAPRPRGRSARCELCRPPADDRPLVRDLSHAGRALAGGLRPCR